MQSEIRKLAIDLYGSDERDLVKMAGIFSGLKTYIRRLYTKIFQQERYRFEDSNAGLKNIISELYSTFKLLDESIESYDLDAYKLQLDNLKTKLGELTTLLAGMQSNVTEIKETARDQAASMAKRKPPTPAEKRDEGLYSEYLTNKKKPKSLQGQVLSQTDAFKGLINKSEIHITDVILKVAKDWLLKNNITVDPSDDSKLLDAMRDCAFNGVIQKTIVKPGQYAGNIHFSVEGTADLNFASPPVTVTMTQQLRYDPNHQRINITHFMPFSSSVSKTGNNSEGDDEPFVDREWQNDDDRHGDDIADIYGSFKRTTNLAKFGKKPGHIQGHLGDDFYPQLIAMCKRIQMHPEDLLAVMELESGMDPAIPNHASGKAVGLIQFMPSTLRGLGLSGSDAEVAGKVRGMTGTEQLKLIEQYIKGQMKINGGRPFKSAAQYYVANFWPVALRYPKVRANDPSAVIVSQNGPRHPHNEPAAYNENKGLDLDHDGKITLGDLMTWMDQIKQRGAYKNLLSSLEAAGHRPDPGEPETREQPEPKQMAINPNVSTKTLEEVIKGIVQQVPVLASSQSLIEVHGRDHISNSEFVRILKYALRNELGIIANIRFNDSIFQLSFDKAAVDTNKISCLCQQVSQDFIKAASLSHPIRFYVFEKKETSVEPLHYTKAEQFYRMFRLNYLSK